MTSSRITALLVSLLLAVTLAGCTKVEDTLFKAAMNTEYMMAGLEVAETQVDDIHWVYLRNEWKPERQTVVLLHGFTADKTNWPRFVGALGDQYNYLVPDLPGHGDTTHDMNLAYDIDTQARRVISLMNHLGVEKFHIAGNSMGGAISLQVAWLAPAQVLSLGLVNAAGVHAVDSEFDLQLKQGLNPLIVKKPEDIKTVLEWAMADPPFIPWPVPQVMGRIGAERAALHDKIFTDLRRDNGIDRSGILQAVVVPSLVLWGDQDRLLNVANADAFAAGLPKATKVIMPGIGHAPMLEAPGEAAKIYSDFLAAR